MVVPIGNPLEFVAVIKSEQAYVGVAFFIVLPGNPVSIFVTFLLFVRPFILKLQGRETKQSQSYLMRADFDWLKADRRNEFLRVKLNNNGGLDLFPNQSSGVLTSVVWGDGVVDNPGSNAIHSGDLVHFYPFSEWLQ